MKLYIIVCNVEGLTNQVNVRKTLPEAKSLAVDIAAEQCDSTKEQIAAELNDHLGFTSNNGDIVVTIHEGELPGSGDPNRLTIRVPVVVLFTTDPEEMDDREGENPPTKRSLVEYLSEAPCVSTSTPRAPGSRRERSSPPPGSSGTKAELIEG